MKEKEKNFKTEVKRNGRNAWSSLRRENCFKRKREKETGEKVCLLTNVSESRV